MSEERRFHRRNVPAARRLRRPLTSTEALLWDRLRNRRCHGLKFRRQHPVGAFVLDFYCDDRKVGVEIDGGIHRLPKVAERHDIWQQLRGDAGIGIVRIPGDLISRDVEAALAWLETQLEISTGA